MSFPISPVNGQIHDEYKYSTITGSWNKNEIITVDTIRVKNNPSFSGGRMTGHKAFSYEVYTPETIYHNIGNCYNTNTNEFTAPIAGKYLCTFSALIYSNYSVTGHAHVSFEVNGVQVGVRNHSMHNMSRKYEPLSNTVIVDVNVGDKITCKLFTGNGTTVFSAQYSSLGICQIG